jgi:hypothetical protein
MLLRPRRGHSRRTATIYKFQQSARSQEKTGTGRKAPSSRPASSLSDEKKRRMPKHNSAFLILYSKYSDTLKNTSLVPKFNQKKGSRHPIRGNGRNLTYFSQRKKTLPYKIRDFFWRAEKTSCFSQRTIRHTRLCRNKNHRNSSLKSKHFRQDKKTGGGT